MCAKYDAFKYFQKSGSELLFPTNCWGSNNFFCSFFMLRAARRSVSSSWHVMILERRAWPPCKASSLYRTIMSPSSVLTSSMILSDKSLLHFFMIFVLLSVSHSSIKTLTISACFLFSQIFRLNSCSENLANMDFVNADSFPHKYFNSTWAICDLAILTPTLVAISLMHSSVIPSW